MKALVISGGGCKGAFAGGVAEYLIESRGREYDIFVGTSTGSLMVPLLASGEISRLRRVYSNVRQEDIFSINPFRIRKKKGQLKVSINHFNTLRMFLKGARTFGNSANLRNLIKDTFRESAYERVKQSRKKVIVTVSNLTRSIVEYKYLKDYSYEDFIDWIWISANSVPFMSLVTKGGYEYADGGFGNLVPIQEAINIGATEIDVIVLSPRVRQIHKAPSKNAFNLLMKAFDFMLNQIGRDDMSIGMLEVMLSDVQLNFYHTPYNLTEYPYVFDPEQMTAWWQMGFDHASKKLPDQIKVENRVA